MGLTPTERKTKVAKLKEEHNDYFETENIKNALYIPKMAYRPAGKDELYISFFPSEMEKEEDIYTEFVSIDYDTEDPKRTLYLLKHNPHWKGEYELIKSSSGFVRHMIPVSELKVIRDVTTKVANRMNQQVDELIGKKKSIEFFNIADPEATPSSELVNKLEDINQTLITLTKVINKLIK